MRECHCRIRQWSLRSETKPGHKNVTHPASVDKSNNYKVPLHINFGLIEIFVKAMDKDRELLPI